MANSPEDENNNNRANDKGSKKTYSSSKGGNGYANPNARRELVSGSLTGAGRLKDVLAEGDATKVRIPQKTSSRPFKDAIYYECKDDKGNTHYLYHTGARLLPDKNATIRAMLIVIAVAIFAVFFVANKVSFFPEKMNMNYDSKIVVEDRLNVADAAALEAAMKSVQDASGLTPAVEFVAETDWKADNKDLKSYARSEYQRLFTDNMHWLIIVSFPEGYKDNPSATVEWSTVAGQETSSTLTVTSSKMFEEIFNTNLTGAKTSEVASKLTDSLNSFSAVMMDEQRDESLYLICVAVFIIGLLWAGAVYRTFIRDGYLYNGTPIFDDGKKTKRNTCKFCGVVYEVGAKPKCDNCGRHTPGFEGNDD